MRNMALIVNSENDRPSPKKVWQPWYIEDGADRDGRGPVRSAKDLPSRAHREQRMRERLGLSRQFVQGTLTHPYAYTHPYRNTPSPSSQVCHPGYSSDDEINVVDSPPPTPAHTCTYTSLPGDIDDNDDGPIDMTINKRRSPSPPTQVRCNNSPPVHGSRARPSVIISCAPNYPPPVHTSPRPEISVHPAHTTPQELSALSRPYPMLMVSQSSVPPQSHPPPSYSDSRSTRPPPYNVAIRTQRDVPQPQRSQSPPLSSAHVLVREREEAIRQGSPPARSSADEAPNVRRKVVQAGPSDPEIDEHFRRSLGANYRQLFSNSQSPPPSADSVDDHFAKALGDTWTKLKAVKRDQSSTPPAISANDSVEITPTITTRTSTPPNSLPVTIIPRPSPLPPSYTPPESLSVTLTSAPSLIPAPSLHRNSLNNNTVSVNNNTCSSNTVSINSNTVSITKVTSSTKHTNDIKIEGTQHASMIKIPITKDRADSPVQTNTVDRGGLTPNSPRSRMIST